MQGLRVILQAVVSSGLVFSPALSAASLESATVTQTRNDVQLTEGRGQARPAVVKDIVNGWDVLRTGMKSRAEVLFNDNTIARLGANSAFSFVAGTDQLKIDRGSALIHVPPGHPGAKIKSPAATVAVLGDVVAMRIGKGGVTQIVALSEDPRGPITVTFDKTGEKRELKAGEMLVIDPADVKMPEISVINVEVFARSSGLVNGFGKPLPETAKREIQKSLDDQNKEIKGGSLEGRADASIPDMQELPSTDPTIVQAAIGNSVAGTYRGLAKDLFPSTFVGNMTLNINGDSSFTGTIRDTVSAFTTTFSGSASNNGNFTAVDSAGQTITGTVTLGGGSASGSYANPVSQGVFNVNK